MFEWCTQYFTAGVSQSAMLTVQVCSMLLRYTVFPGWSLSLKVVSRVVIFPNETFPRIDFVNGRLNVQLQLTLKSSTERPYCVYLNGFTVNSPHCQFAPTNQLAPGKYEASWYPVLPGSSSF